MRLREGYPIKTNLGRFRRWRIGELASLRKSFDVEQFSISADRLRAFANKLHAVAVFGVLGGSLFFAFIANSRIQLVVLTIRQIVFD